MSDQSVLTETRDGVMTITLNRPDVRNAFDDDLIAALTGAYRQAHASADVRVAVLRGEGPSFSAGADIRWMQRASAMTREENLADARKAAELFKAIAECSKVTIARVHGAAMGGGAGVVAASDVAIAAQSAVFAFSEVALGLAPAVISPYVVARIGAAARSRFVTGAKFDAGEALQIGLVDEVVADDSIDDAVERRIAQVLAASPNAIAATKALLRKLQPIGDCEIADYTAQLIADLRVSDEGREGLTAFLAKRKPGYAK